MEWELEKEKETNYDMAEWEGLFGIEDALF